MVTKVLQGLVALLDLFQLVLIMAYCILEICLVI